MGNRPVKFVQSYLWFFCAILFLLAVFFYSASVKIYSPTQPPPYIHVWPTVVGFVFCPVIGEIDDSLKALKEKQQRTVYRLTLVKGWNTEDIDAYSSLFSHGEPDFIEIKGVTYCGSSATSKLTMENVPWHADVKAFSEALAQKSEGRYELACEHVHSCCVLLARVDKFKINGLWFTWIDYEKFHDLVASGKPFDSRDYMAVTPSWAVYGADEGGFDPGQLRYRKERHHKK